VLSRSLVDTAGNFFIDFRDLVYLILARIVGLTLSAEESWDEMLLLLVRW
jgi:hypothetical protein